MQEKESNFYKVIFVDPKSTAFNDVNLKIEGYQRVFEKREEYEYGDKIIKPKLVLYNKDGAGKIAENNWKYWASSMEKIFFS
ncbi:MAG TPA: hypothetical protein GX392_06225 [Clostridiales bacterium]|nr:hypothetical protein [Clostridiales bacterium]